MCLAEDFSDNEEMFAKDITKWSSNDLMDKIETIEVDEAQGLTVFLLAHNHTSGHHFINRSRGRSYVSSCAVIDSKK